MSSYWVNIFYELVKSGRKTVEDVPESIRQQVADRLAADQN